DGAASGNVSGVHSRGAVAPAPVPAADDGVGLLADARRFSEVPVAVATTTRRINTRRTARPTTPIASGGGRSLSRARPWRRERIARHRRAAPAPRRSHDATTTASTAPAG